MLVHSAVPHNIYAFLIYCGVSASHVGILYNIYRMEFVQFVPANKIFTQFSGQLLKCCVLSYFFSSFIEIKNRIIGDLYFRSVSYVLCLTV